MPSAPVYWVTACSTILAIAVAVIVPAAILRARSRVRRKIDALSARPGMAVPTDIARHAGSRALVRKSAELRPGAAKKRRS